VLFTDIDIWNIAYYGKHILWSVIEVWLSMTVWLSTWWWYTFLFLLFF